MADGCARVAIRRILVDDIRKSCCGEVIRYFVDFRRVWSQNCTVSTISRPSQSMCCDWLWILLSHMLSTRGMSKVYFCSFLYVILRGVWSSKWSIRIHKNRQGLTYDWIALLGNPRHRWQIRLTHSYPTWQINKASIPWSVWLDCQHQGHRLHFCHDTARLFSFIEPASGVYFNGIFGTHSEVSRLFPEYPGSPISDNRNTWSFNPHYLVSSIDKMLMSLTGYCDE